jgi:hypothetical protein
MTRVTQHLLAAATTIGGAVVVGVVGYGVLFIGAAIGGSPVGSPLNFLVIPAFSAASVGVLTIGVATPLSLLLLMNHRLRQPRAIGPSIVGAGISVLGVLWLLDCYPAFGRGDPAVVVGLVVVGLVFSLYWAVLKLTADSGRGGDIDHAV